MLLRCLCLCFALTCLPLKAGAKDFRALARVLPEASAIEDRWLWKGVEIRLGLSQAVPWRVILRADPARLILDFREVQWSGVDMGALDASDRVTRVRTGQIEAGWSRMVAELDGAYVVRSATMETDAETGVATVVIHLAGASEQAFATAVAESAAQEPWALSSRAAPEAAPKDASGPITIVLDPGHGGIDPGAEYNGVKEADLMLLFALEMQEALVRRGGYRVLLTRTADSFVPLTERVSFARAAGADLFLSLHADALPPGETASGARVFTLSEEASDAASARLAETHRRTDLILGVDLGAQDDEIAELLMELVRREITPQSAALAQALVEGLEASVGDLHKTPRPEAEFAVLRAPDIPSVLLEIGFMSNVADLRNLLSKEWRLKAIEGLIDGIEAWVLDDAALALRLRR